MSVAAADVPSIFPVLHKARTDKMKQYVENKRRRLADKQKEQKYERPSADDVCKHQDAKRHTVTVDN